MITAFLVPVKRFFTGSEPDIGPIRGAGAACKDCHRRGIIEIWNFIDAKN